MKRVYVAGAYSSDKTMGVFNNMRRGMRASTEVFLAGFFPFCPWLDFHFILMLRENEELTIEQYYEYGIAWLEVSDAILVLPNSEHSRGTKLEMAKAMSLGIPVYYSLEELCRNA